MPTPFMAASKGSTLLINILLPTGPPESSISLSPTFNTREEEDPIHTKAPSLMASPSLRGCQSSTPFLIRVEPVTDFTVPSAKDRVGRAKSRPVINIRAFINILLRQLLFIVHYPFLIKS